MIVAAVLLAIQLDPSTGLWFPPYATRTEYLNRDPAHPYMRDVERAFTETPALVAEVCGAYLAAPEPQTAEVHDPSVRQYRTMLAMACTARHAQARRREEEVATKAKVVSMLEVMFEAEEHSATDGAANGPLRSALRGIARSPNDVFAITTLMSLPVESGASPQQIAAFLDQLYRTRAATGDRWKAGLPAVLLFEGKLEESRKAAEEWFAVAPRDQAPAALAMVAVARRALGDEGAFDKLPPDSATTLVVDALDILREHAPHGLVDAAFDLERRNGGDWASRLELVGGARYAEPRGAEKRFYEMLSDRDIPHVAQSDATYYLMTIAAALDPSRVAPLVDCWLDTRSVKIPQATASTWSRLAAMSPKEGSPKAECSGSSASSWCVMHALGLRLEAAEKTKRWDLAKQTIEKMAAITVENRLSAEAMRNELKDFARTDNEIAAAIDSYLASSSPQPWQTPVAIDPPLPAASCPPRAP